MWGEPHCASVAAVLDVLHEASEQLLFLGGCVFREAYERAKPTILEPIMRVEVQFPEEFQGAVLGQINQRRGTIISTEKMWLRSRRRPGVDLGAVSAGRLSCSPPGVSAESPGVG